MLTKFKPTKLRNRTLWLFDDPEGGAPASTDPAPPPVDPTPAAVDPAPTPPAVDFPAIVPEAYRDKPYMQNIKSIDSLFQQLDNAQSLIGKKTIGVPEATATPEEWDSFFSKIRPENPDGYELKTVELPEDKANLQQYFDKVRTPEYEKDLKQLFHKAGLTAKQAEILTSEYDQLILKHDTSLTEMAEAMAAKDKAFDELTTKAFGDQKDSALLRTKSAIKEFANDALADKLEQMDGDTLAAFAIVVDGLIQKYGKEDSYFTSNPVGSGGSLNPAALRSEAVKLQQDPRYTNPFHPEHSAVKERILSLYSKANQLSS